MLLFLVTSAASVQTASILNFEFTARGMNYVIFDLFKAPLAILGFGIPILGLLGINHRSAQTKRQIQLSELQNNFTNYYKHIDEFDKYIVETLHGEKWFKSSMERRHLHKKLFPKASEGQYSLDVTLRREVESIVKDIYTKLERLVSVEPANIPALIESLISEARNLSYIFNFDEQILYADYFSSSSIDDSFKPVWNSTAMVSALLTFDQTYQERKLYELIAVQIATIQIDQFASQVESTLGQNALKSAIELLDMESK